MTIDVPAAALPPPPLELVRGCSLFLDFDGTLVDLVPDPAGVEVDDRLRSLLSTLQRRLEGRVAVLTGRAADEARQFLHPLDLLIAGSHGLELGDLAPPARPQALDDRLTRLRELAARHPGVIVEDKPAGVALHFRQAPDAEEVCRQAAEETALMTGLEIQPGKMVFELKPKGGNKGNALCQMMEAPTFSGTRPLFLGDDLTDEPAFEAAQALGGAGILVGAPRQTAATFGLQSVSDALAWLETAAEDLA